MAERDHSFKFVQVLHHELGTLEKNRNEAGEKEVHSPDPSTAFERAVDANLAGLAFSGGGIRSATFGLGVLQALAQPHSDDNSVDDADGDSGEANSPRPALLSLFDYLSTVSGGGYIGSWFSAWLHRESLERGDHGEKAVERLAKKLSIYPCSRNGADDESDCAEASGIRKPLTSGFPPVEHAAIRHLRRFSNYLTPRLGVSGDLLAVVSLFTRNLVILQMSLIALVATVLLAPYVLSWITGFAIDLYPDSTDLSKGLILGGGLLLLFVMGVWRWQFKDMDRPPEDEKELEDWRENALRKRKATDRWMKSSVALMPLAYWLMVTGLVPILDHDVETIGAVQAFFVWPYAISYLIAWFFSPGPESPGKGESERANFLKRTLIALVAAFVFGWLIHLSSVLLDVDGFDTAGRTALLDVVAVPTILMILSFTIALQLGLGRNLYSERERERWARVGGMVLLAAGVWLLVFAIAVYAPALVSWLGNGGWGVLIGWLGASGAGAWIARNALASGDGVPKLWKVILAGVVPWIFILGLAIFLSFLLGMVVRSISLEIPLGNFEAASEQSVAWGLEFFSVLFEASRLQYPLLFLFGTGLVFLLLSWRLDLNIFSAFSIYRNRLVRAYLGASNLMRRSAHPISGFDPRDDVDLSGLENQRPIPVINTTINMTGGDDLAWQSRRAASFTFTPNFVGYETKNSRGTDLGAYRPVSEYGKSESIFAKKENAASQGREITLGTAMAISGAAASPNMGRFTSASLSALLTVFNLRTGYWAGNPKRSGHKSEENHKVLPAWRRKRPLLSVWPLLAELSGTANAEASWVNLSDGGHFENLGIYELVRRRCRLIVAVDAGCDPDHQFVDLANAIRKCWTDFGVQIMFPKLDEVRLEDANRRICQSHSTLGLIRYPGRRNDAEKQPESQSGHDGLILYLKCSLTDYEMEKFTDIREYAESRTDFPHESTSDQFFDEEQFEAYRHLGYCAAWQSRSLIEKLVDKSTHRLSREKVRASIREVLDSDA